MATTSHNRAAAAAIAAAAMLLCQPASRADMHADPKVKVDDHTFKCITQLTHVRHFYVDNLEGNLQDTVKVAETGKGDYPEGSVIQLVPTEVMVKQQKGFSPETRDWEFFALDVDKNGTKIYARGFKDVNNRFGLNCFTCHKAADTSFDFVCEENHGCAPIPITQAMFLALQRTDPRCPNQGQVLAEDQKSLADLQKVVAALKASIATEKK